MNNDNYLEVLHKNMDAVKNGEAKEEMMPLLQWLMNYRPATYDGDDVEYKTTAEIQATMADMVTIDLNLISTVMWRLGYEVSVSTVYPTWAMIQAN